MAGDVYVDAALFLGMHSTDESMRIACKSFFAARLSDHVVMSWEQVGRCDDLVWRFPRAVQDAYYPFMDNLHTDMRIERRGYDAADLRVGLLAELDGLAMHERLLAGMVLNRNGMLWSVSPRLLAHASLPVRAPKADVELLFPDALERLYRTSLALRVPMTEL
ncbi:MAG: hypothetical protein JO115_01740 [Pseudonocardiales bacterium]|nr:hypothetical protein [Pseudonocardiales bacterium]